MNLATVLVGLASGAASAALSTALASGTTLSLFLFILAPLPILIAALGWRHHAGIIGAATGTLLLYLLLGYDTAQGYALSVGFPAWWLGYLALLGRPADPGTPEAGVVWYPVGRLVVWAAGIGAALVLATVLLHGGTLEEYRATLRTVFEQFLRVETGTPEGQPITLPGGRDAQRILDLSVAALPPVAASGWTAVALLNLWVAGRVVRASGRLSRPWPYLAAMSLPRLTLAAFLGGVLGSLLPGLFGFAAGVIGSAFSVPFLALGLALLHAGTAGTRGRTLLLSVAYVLMSLQPWLALIVTILGVFEFLFGIRARIAASRTPPPPSAIN